jgi:S-adenosylmethionine hydrolase
VITLLTDCGLEDEYVGVMKGVVLSINPAVHLVDLTHAIGRHDIEQGALILSASYRHFPKGSIHIAVVDPGVGGARKVVCLRQGGHVFLAPDNGLLSMVIDEKKVEDVRAVTNRKYFLEWVSDTFHGRDIFAPVAAHLSGGVDPVCLGESLDPKELTLFDIDYPHVSEKGELVGKVITVDHFGNLVTNIDRGCLEAFRGAGRLKS